ncbi:hypothetical protein L249_6939 [Ophiocordyceps polyrhachis-furcata BCC 54312]|uniref:Cwf19-like C-terminal domain-containing protein n=1 Tax=Ophiocordyceps polyrhachis-furcata BCC 54312 TaxID=1330021 RepID=A0A367LJT9_9HYPO|nr:hypothetical protein L249_6939 [Ophiocordyceps polyrhachis-furcata BCC 54312]
MANPKIIVLGSLDGELESAAQKLATLQAKNGFSMAILTGNAFAPTLEANVYEALANGKLTFPLPTYFTVGTHPLPEQIAAKVEADEEIGQNLYFLAKRSITTTADGVRIAVLGGFPGSAQADADAKNFFHTDDDAKALRGGTSRIDILLTSIWPADIWRGTSIVLEPAHQAVVKSTQTIANVCAGLKPRYHLAPSAGAFFFEREPFEHPSTTDSEADTKVFTRFISLAPYGNSAKAKSMYAFSLNKSDAVPAGATTSPFLVHSKKRTRDEEAYGRFGRYHDDDGRRGRGRRPRERPGPNRCYFCLSNPDVSTHMCCSIGDESYISTAKGPLPTPTTFSEHELTFPGHFIIIPLPHAATSTAMGTAEEAKRTYDEMSRFRNALQAMLSTVSSHKLGAVTWEISRERNVHLIWQLIALPAEMIQSGVAEAAFRVEAENHGYPTLIADDLTLEKQATCGDFFRIWLWADNGEDKITGKSLVMPLFQGLPFDLQFGRRVVAKLLGLDARFIWQQCQQTVEEEKRDVEAFRRTFKDWDFTLT